jgi:bla regulator protein BlaR1
MIEKCLSTIWNTLAPGLANHLWQSTLVAVAAGLLTLILRQHHARVRYWLWLAASLKFLAPFSLLVSIGKSLAWSHNPTPAASPALYLAMQEISQPFTQAAPAVGATTASTVQPGLIHFLPLIAAAIWLCGFLAVPFVWTMRWRRISAAIKSSDPLREGREVGALRRLERVGGIRKQVDMLLSRASLEPGIFGITRPVLIWPEGISHRLEDAHLEAILAHELWHVRRRDNLYAALHMLVEAVFWFYPLVWWLGSRLLEERERACDEEVIELISDRQVYAESILKVCEFCLSSPLVCVSGVTGADLKQRMVHIMSDRRLHKLDFAKKLLLTAAAFLAIAVPITLGLFHATPSQAQPQSDSTPTVAPTFESVSIKRSRDTGDKFYAKTMFSLQDGSFTARGVTLQRLIQMAYRVQDTQISGPVELNTTKFDIDAKLNRGAADALLKQQKGFDDQLALKTLLAQRFKLVLHPEARNLPVYHLFVVDGGSKMQESKSGRFIHLERGELDSQGIPIHILTEQLSQILGQTVLDSTGLAGNYAFTLRWTPDAAEDARFRGAEDAMGAKAPGSPDPNGPPLATALEEQLGLKVESNTEPVQVLVVDHVEMPSAN